MHKMRYTKSARLGKVQQNSWGEIFNSGKIRFSDMNKLLKRQQNIVNRKNWTCKFCGIVETNITKFAVHISDHYTKQLRKICEICKATFSTRKVGFDYFFKAEIDSRYAG